MLSVMQSPHGPGLPYPVPRPPSCLYGPYPGYPSSTNVRIKTEPDVYSCCAGYAGVTVHILPKLARLHACACVYGSILLAPLQLHHAFPGSGIGII